MAFPLSLLLPLLPLLASLAPLASASCLTCTCSLRTTAAGRRSAVLAQGLDALQLGEVFEHGEGRPLTRETCAAHCRGWAGGEVWPTPLARLCRRHGEYTPPQGVTVLIRSQVAGVVVPALQVGCGTSEGLEESLEAMEEPLGAAMLLPLCCFHFQGWVPGHRDWMAQVTHFLETTFRS